MLKVKHFIVINYFSGETFSDPFESEPTLEDIEKFWKETWIWATTDGSGNPEKLYPNMSDLDDGYAEVRKRYYWSQGSK